MSTSSRDVAYEVLCAVREKDAYANLILPGILRRSGLDPRDVAMATELTYGALRRQGSLDAVIDACSDRGEIDGDVRDVLRLGSYQLLFMRVPAHAAVDETVEQVKATKRSAAGFANAIMRKVANKTWAEWLGVLQATLDPIGRLSVEFSQPQWVIRALMDAYALDAASVPPLLAACNEPAPVTLVARPGQCEVAELLAIEGASPGRHSPFAVSLARGSNPGDIAAVREHRAGVQDEGSQIVALRLADASVQGPESAWLDLCAGPGGKAALLAGLAAQRSVHLTAVEPNPTRADLVTASLQHAPGSPTIVVADGRDIDFDTQFDRILVDAPCTGLGALRRRPESRWRKQPGDVPTLAKLQRELLDSASGKVRVGGVIGYATCSPHIAETDVVVGKFLSAHKDFEFVEPPIRLRPDVDGTDGMYLALLRRIG